MNILVTGGAGYIGSHTCVELLEAGYEVIVVDNLSNSNVESLKRVREITGKNLDFYEIDLREKSALVEVFKKHSFDAVIHFAGLKAVGESGKIPLLYYDNNISGTISLCKVMEEFEVRNIVFSSSATVYGDPDQVPINEDFPVLPVNTYGRTKLMIEEILGDIYQSNKKCNIAILRYFNPVGAHSSGEIGEDPNGIPNNLFPYICQTGVGKLPELSVFGNDYPTPDGTGVRDYIHVTDLAQGHIKALEKLSDNPGIEIYNLGTGRGYSVFEMISAFEKASGKKIKYEIVGRRDGDIAICYADPSKAKNELGWTANRDIDEMSKDAWKWQSNNPDGYSK
jgi:UDP-glucose 4-epimerase